jgi:hypothetical protein
MYAVPAERAHGASWGENINEIIGWGNRQRGRRLGDDLFLAKLDAYDRKFFHLEVKGTEFDPAGPETQVITFPAERCDVGLGCSVLDADLSDVELFKVDPDGQIHGMTMQEARDYSAKRPGKIVDLRTVSQTASHGSIYGMDVRVRMNQDQGPYRGRWEVVLRDDTMIVQGAKSMNAAVKAVTDEIHENMWNRPAAESGTWQHGKIIDLLPKSKRKIRVKQPSYEF